MFKRIGELKFDYKYLAVFIVLFVGTMIVFYMTGTIVNIIWILFIGLVFLFYFKDFIMPICSHILKRAAKK